MPRARLHCWGLSSPGGGVAKPDFERMVNVPQKAVTTGQYIWEGRLFKFTEAEFDGALGFYQKDWMLEGKPHADWPDEALLCAILDPLRGEAAFFHYVPAGRDVVEFNGKQWKLTDEKYETFVIYREIERAKS